MPTLTISAHNRDHEGIGGDRSALTCAAGQIEECLEKVRLQYKGTYTDRADTAFCDAMTWLESAAAELRAAADALGDRA